MKTIALSLSLVNQDEFETINLINQVGRKVYSNESNIVLLHCLPPPHILSETGESIKVISVLDSLFPMQLNLWNDYPLRNELAQTANNLFADVYFLGTIKGDVLDEFQLFRNYSLVNLFTVTTADGIRPINPNSLMG